MIDIQTEKLVPLREVPNLEIIPRRRGGSRLDVTTVFRWALHGQRGVTLETVKIGGQRCTSIGALQRFFGALSGSDRKIAPARSAGRQRVAKSSPATQARLDALGI